VGFTGAVVPGNVLLITVTETTQKGWKGGESIILGHCVLEILLVGSIFLGMGALWNNPTTTFLTPLIGGAVLVLFGLTVPRNLTGPTSTTAISQTMGDSSPKTSFKQITRGISLGATTSAANPYFLLWWITIGGVYITQLLPFLPLSGVSLFTSAALIYFAHIAADIIWYTIIIMLVSKGVHLLNAKSYKYLLIASACIMIFLGARFLWQGITLLMPL
jgi:threonine/homoserine/homoserine lactone efflux protein